MRGDCYWLWTLGRGWVGPYRFKFSHIERQGFCLCMGKIYREFSGRY